MKSARPPYPLCWWCNRQFYAYRGVCLERNGAPVWVHRKCADEMAVQQ